MQRSFTSLFTIAALLALSTLHPVGVDAKSTTKKKKKKKRDTTGWASLCAGKPAISPKDRRAHSILNAVLDVTSELSLLMDGSSQHLATCWLIHDDRRKLSGTSSQFYQRYALVTLFFATNGRTKWDTTGNWLSKQDECDWMGIKCARSFTSRYVVEIDLGFYNLHGLLPRELSLLKHVVEVDLHGNEIQGVVPHAILTSWKKLKILRLHMNGLFGKLPGEIGTLTNLEELYLFGNYFTGDIPKELVKLKKLKKLDIYANNFSGKIPSELGKIKTLRELDVHDNDLTGSMPKSICDNKLDELVADCWGQPYPEVRCDCCHICCQGLPVMKCYDMRTHQEIRHAVGQVPDSDKKKSSKKKSKKKKK